MAIVLIDGYKFERTEINGCHYLVGEDEEVKGVIVTSKDSYEEAKKKVRANMYYIMQKNEYKAKKKTEPKKTEQKKNIKSNKNNVVITEKKFWEWLNKERG